MASLQGMILAAGFGTRMRPLSLRLPKALLPVAGRPLLEWNLRFLASCGVRRAVVNAHHRADDLLDFLRTLGPAEPMASDLPAPNGASPFDGPPPGGWLIRPRSAGLPEIRLLRETEILGTAGGIGAAGPCFDDGPLLVMNVDLLFRPEIGPALDRHERGGRLATLFCVRDPLHAQLRLRGDEVAGILPYPLPDDPELWAFTGVYLLSAEAVARLRAASRRDGGIGFREIVPDFRAWIEEGRLGAARVQDRPFREAGTPETYLELLREAAGPGRDLLLGPPGEEAAASGMRTAPAAADGAGPADHSAGYGFVEAGAEVGPGAEIIESAVFAGAVVASGARVVRSVLGAGSVTEGEVLGLAAAAGERRGIGVLSPAEEEHLAPWVELNLAGASPAGGPAHGGDGPARGGGGQASTSYPLRIRRLHGDGSSRRVLRVLREETSRILMVFPPPTPVEGQVYPRRSGPDVPTEMECFLYVAGYLRSMGIRLPAIHAWELQEGWVLMEDLGDRHLADALAAARSGRAGDEGTVSGLYREALRLLLAAQGFGPVPPGSAPFDPARTHNLPYDIPFILNYEAGYFCREMVEEACGGIVGFADLAPVFRAVAAAALEEAPLRFMHRDFQSRNLMLTSRGLAMIDFQGARLGPPEYDLASLLLDPYSALPFELREELLGAYLEERLRAEEGAGLPVAAHTHQIMRRYRACGINRTLQALGAYAYLGGRMKKPGFLEHIPQALAHLMELTTGSGSRFAALRGPFVPELSGLADHLGRWWPAH